MNNESRGHAFYEHFFKFHRPPFSLAPDTRFRFQSASHAAAMTQITYTLDRREPIIVVTGEIGTGKTLLCRTIVEQSDRKTFVSTINDPQLDGDDLLKRLLEDFGVLSKDRTMMTPASRHDLVHALQEFLASLKPIQAHAAVIVDEAHHMRPDALEQIRLLSNIQDERGTMLQIILVGQPDLERVLSQPSLRQLSQRVSRFVRLEPLSADELTQYIEHRLGVARARPLPTNFPGARELERELSEWDASKADFPFMPDAIAAVGRLSRGVPRVVNLLCDRALEAAYSRQLETVDAPLIATAAEALGLATNEAAPAASPVTVWPDVESAHETPADEPAPAGPPQAGRYAVIAAVLALAAAAAWFGVREIGRRSAPEPASQVQAPPAQPAPLPQAAPPAAAPAREAATPSATPATTPTTPPPAAPSARSPQTTPQTTATAATSAQARDRFEIVVASFRTAVRANDVAAAIAALPEPVRQRSAGGWEQVLAGPYTSADQAREAQQRLERAGFTGTHITPVSR